ncbi:Mitomycin radical oxidase [Usitatibacter rugosus]|uniref:Mitomycin radical oxidase n=1 Tax=Usitatibacter rugosus TaxID=2732067 RepID=A0A6M4H1C0_9PROT|nr:FAD-binding oxidoreductase [Usitatibacter rugosus]QJR12453.1 Mitomycin radical oxidase [Usitatibacter rugosus]
MTIQLKQLDGGTLDLPAEALAAFRTSFKGAVLGPADPDYEATRALWNAMIDRRPGLILRCTGVADVVQAVKLVRQHRLLSSVRGGGHNIAGLAACEGGVMIDLSLLRGVWVDAAARTARAQAGCRLGDVDRETQLHGLAAVLGFVSDTGIAGLTVGGGFGYLTRKHGWTCDTVLSMDVVTAAGELVRASASENADLFWALRGGGGNFGIVTSFEYQLHPVGPEILGGAIAWRAEEAGEVLRAYAKFSAAAPRELTTVAVLRIAPPAPWLPKEVHGKTIVALFVCYAGRVEDGEAFLAPLRKLGKPVADIVTRRPYVQMQSLLDATQPKGRRYYWKSHYLPRIDPRAIEIALEHAGRIRSPHSAILMFQVGGALGDLPAGHSPAGNRDAAYVLNIAGSWEKPEDDAANIAWARDCFEAARECSTGGTYVNFLTEEEGPDRIEAAYGARNLARLAALKAQIDPDDLFRHTKRVSG